MIEMWYVFFLYVFLMKLITEWIRNNQLFFGWIKIMNFDKIVFEKIYIYIYVPNIKFYIETREFIE